MVHRLGEAKVTVTAAPLLCQLLELHLARTRGLAAHISVVQLYHHSPRQEKRPFSTSHGRDVTNLGKKPIKSGAQSRCVQEKKRLWAEYSPFRMIINYYSSKGT